MIKILPIMFLSLLIIILQQNPCFSEIAYINRNLTNPTTIDNYNPAYGDYYLQSMEMKENKWNIFPITIYIKQVPQRYKGIVTDAINKWGSYIPLKICNSEYESDIIISWIYKMPPEYKGIVGLADHKYNQGIHKCKILVLYKKNYSYLENEEIVIHELGHALALDHSRNYNDIMYKKIKPYKKAIPGKSLITQRDINTLIRIYSDSNSILSHESVFTGF